MLIFLTCFSTGINLSLELLASLISYSDLISFASQPPFKLFQINMLVVDFVILTFDSLLQLVYLNIHFRYSRLELIVEHLLLLVFPVDSQTHFFLESMLLVL